MIRQCALILLLTLGLAGVASGGVLNVPGDYAQINDAVQACAPGDTVLVAAGTWHDCTHPTEGPGTTPASVIMKSGVTLRGAGPDQTIIDAQSLGRGIFIEAVSDCRVENMRVTGAFASVPADAGGRDGGWRGQSVHEEDGHRLAAWRRPWLNQNCRPPGPGAGLTTPVRR